MSWSSSLYSKVFQGIGDFHLRENDYVFGNHKFGGNAQSITKNRWIHHTSFLWDFNVQNMSYLKHPKRAPAYRSARSHLDFICRMKDYMPRSTFMDKTVEATETQFSLRPIQLEAIRTCLEAEFCPSSRFLTNEELEAAAVALQSWSSLQVCMIFLKIIMINEVNPNESCIRLIKIFHWWKLEFYQLTLVSIISHSSEWYWKKCCFQLKMNKLDYDSM